MKDRVLTYLKGAGADWVSGGRLGEKMGLTRAAVWKQVCRLRAEGYVIDSSPRKGYFLRRVSDSLLPAEIQSRLDTDFIGREVVYRPQVASTNGLARTLAVRGACAGTIVVAETQTAGKGRRGRAWFSPPGAGIYLSIILRPRLSAAEATKFTILTGVALAETLTPLLPGRVEIKWPNDILVGGRKIAGILIEIATEIDMLEYMIVGVGVNVNNATRDFPAELRKTATSLRAETGSFASRAAILGEFLATFEKYCGVIQEFGFAPILARWKKLSNILDKHVTVSLLGDTITGRVSGIDRDGALLIRPPGSGLHRVLSGDLTVLPKRERRRSRPCAARG
jgi:BirA family transcriptional regulator, biotin operon repressor / biotin---[acetyl-CoA-carboxylase] ligase